MTRDEFKVLTKGMKAVYAQPTFIPDADAFNIWYELLQDLSYPEASMAIKKHMQSSKFPPTIADIRKNAATLIHGDIRDWSAGWEDTCRMIRKYGSYNPDKALNELDPLTRTVVERMGFRELCLSENPTADRANFRLIYENEANRHREAAKLSANVRDALGFTERLKLQ